MPTVRIPALVRFFRHVDFEKSAPCWIWTGAGDGRYGRFQPGGKGTRLLMAHRFIYEELVGPIPQGFTIDHVRARGCTHTLCVNIEHLEAVPHRENLLRGNTFQAKNAAKTHCPRGHAYDEANTYMHPIHKGSLARECRLCSRDRMRARRAARKAQA